MAIRGAKPKPAGQARHRNKVAHAWTEVQNVPFDGAPKLPRRCNGRPWPARTRAKWKAISTMPHCVLWGPATWEFAFTTMELAAWFHEGDAKLSAELRAWEKVLGTTATDLRDQRIRYADPPTTEEAGVVTNLADYRDL